MNQYTFEFYEQLVSIVCVALATGVGGFFVAKYKGSRQKTTALETGVRALLRVQMIEFYDRYIVNEAPLTFERQHEIVAVHEAYKGLGGNHGEERIFEELMRKQLAVVDEKWREK